MALQSLESNPQLAFATRMEDWTSLGQHKRHPEFPVVTRESRYNSRKTTWFPRHRKRPLSLASARLRGRQRLALPSERASERASQGPPLQRPPRLDRPHRGGCSAHLGSEEVDRGGCRSNPRPDRTKPGVASLSCWLTPAPSACSTFRLCYCYRLICWPSFFRNLQRKYWTCPCWN